MTSVATVANNINKSFTNAGNTGRGLPPPVPPNKPIVPKREQSGTRLLNSNTAGTASINCQLASASKLSDNNATSFEDSS